ncbi:MAG: hypothetical protein EBR09_12770 [Proteobacteria bacterium]|nr:hypothetical protein [Pseudomonadota bacterium]
MALQIKGKFIQSEAIDGSKLKLKQGEALRATDENGLDIELLKIGPNGEILANGDELALKADLTAEAARAAAAEAALSAGISAEASDRSAADTALQANIDAEAAARAAAVTAEAAARAAAVAAEQSRAQAAEAALQAEIDAEELARAAAVSAEQAAREAADAALSGRLDAVEGAGEGSVAKAKQDAKDYADQKIAELVNSAPAVLDTLKELSDAIGGDQNFAATVAGQVGAVAADLDAEEARALAAEAALSAAISAEEAARIADVNAEESRALSAEASLSASIAAESASRSSAISAEASARETADAALQAEIDAEEVARAAGDAALQAALTAESAARAAQATEISTAAQGLIQTEANARIAGDASTLAAANSYADTRLAALVNSAPEVLDTLKELADAINNDANFAATVAGQVGTVQSNLTAETARAQAAEAALDSRLSASEARTSYKKKVVITSAELSAGHIELDHEATAKSIVAAVGRLMIHECDKVQNQSLSAYSDDFFVEVVAGKSRLVFCGNMVSPSEEQLAVGDVVYVSYMA